MLPSSSSDLKDGNNSNNNSGSFFLLRNRASLNHNGSGGVGVDGSDDNTGGTRSMANREGDGVRVHFKDDPAETWRRQIGESNKSMLNRSTLKIFVVVVITVAVIASFVFAISIVWGANGDVDGNLFPKPISSANVNVGDTDTDDQDKDKDDNGTSLTLTVNAHSNVEEEMDIAMDADVDDSVSESKMKILAVHVSIPLADRKGADARWLNVLQDMARDGHTVDYVGWKREKVYNVPPGQGESHSNALKRTGITIVAEEMERRRDSEFQGFEDREVPMERLRRMSSVVCPGSERDGDEDEETERIGIDMDDAKYRAYDAVIVFFWDDRQYMMFVSELISMFSVYSPSTHMAVLSDDVHYAAATSLSTALKMRNEQQVRSQAQADDDGNAHSPEFERASKLDQYARALRFTELSLLKRFHAIYTATRDDRDMLSVAFSQMHDTDVGADSDAKVKERNEFIEVLPVSSKTVTSPGRLFNLGPFNERDSIVFIGYCNEQNALGLRWFVSEVLQIIQSPATATDARLTPDTPHRYKLNIVGSIDCVRSEMEKVMEKEKGKEEGHAHAQAQVDVKWSGIVKNLQDEFKTAKVFISPVLAGTGISTKSLQAMANGIPLVTTSIGKRGFDGLDGDEDGEEVSGMFIHNSPNQFAKSVIDVMQMEKKEWSTLSDANLRYMQVHFSPSLLQKNVRRVLNRARVFSEEKKKRLRARGRGLVDGRNLCRVEHELNRLWNIFE